MKRLTVAFVVTLCALVCVPSLGVLGNDEPQEGGTLVLGRLRDVVGLDPNMTTAHDSHRLFEVVFSRLVTLDGELLPAPGLAASWDISDDGLVYTFYLHEGVKFHNGEDMTARDVKYTMDRILNPEVGSPVRSFFVAIEAVSVLNDHTVQFKLSRPHAGLLMYLSIPEASIISKDLAEQEDLNKMANVIGTGPFRLAEWSPDEYMLLERHEAYHLPGLPYLDAIDIRIMPEEASLVAALRAGTVDFAMIETAVTAQRVRAIPSAEVMAVPSLRYLPLFVNAGREPLTDPKVRMAMSLAIDRQAIINTVLLGEGEISGPIPPSNPFWAVPTDELPGYVHDVEKARSLLQEAGHADGFSLQLATTSAFAPTAEVVEFQLREIGIRVNIEVLEYGVYIDRWLEADFDLGLSHNSGQPDPDFYLYRYFRSGEGLTFIHGEWGDERLDYLLDRGQVETDLEKRRELYAEAQMILAEGNPFIWLYVRNEYFVPQDHVKGFIPLATGSIENLEAAWLDR